MRRFFPITTRRRPSVWKTSKESRRFALENRRFAPPRWQGAPLLPVQCVRQGALRRPARRCETPRRLERLNSRLIVESNRVAPPQEGRSAAGGLAVGVFDALRETGGLWFGWNGDTAPEAKAAKLEARGNITYATVTLSRKDYDQYYRGFSNAILWPTFHYRNDLARYDRQEYAG